MFYRDRDAISIMSRSQNDQKTPIRWKSRGLTCFVLWKNVARLQLPADLGIRSYPLGH